MGKVIDLGNITKLDLPPDRLLQKAMGELTEVVILGMTPDGKEWFAASKADASNTIYHCHRAIHKLMKIIDEAS
jgi:hypothetical protein